MLGKGICCDWRGGVAAGGLFCEAGGGENSDDGTDGSFDPVGSGLGCGCSDGVSCDGGGAEGVVGTAGLEGGAVINGVEGVASEPVFVSPMKSLPALSFASVGLASG